jgi:hypothetical protein
MKNNPAGDESRWTIFFEFISESSSLTVFGQGCAPARAGP